MKPIQLFPDIGRYSADLSICVVSYYKLVKDLVEKSKNSSSLPRFTLLIFLLGTLTLKLYWLFKFNLTRIFLFEQQRIRVQGPFCDINNGFNGKSHNKLFGIFLSNRWDFFHKPVLPHISIEAATIRNDKRSIQLKKKL